jgi:hypothetical protein
MPGNPLRHLRTFQLAEVDTTGTVRERFLAILVAHHTRHLEISHLPVWLSVPDRFDLAIVKQV